MRFTIDDKHLIKCGFMPITATVQNTNTRRKFSAARSVMHNRLLAPSLQVDDL